MNYQPITYQQIELRQPKYTRQDAKELTESSRNVLDSISTDMFFDLLFFNFQQFRENKFAYELNKRTYDSHRKDYEENPFMEIQTENVSGIYCLN